MQQIVDRIVIDKKIAVPRHPKLVAALHLHTVEQFVDESMNNGRQKDKIVGAAFGFLGRQLDDTRQRSRCLDNGTAAVSAKCILSGQGHDEV